MTSAHQGIKFLPDAGAHYDRLQPGEEILHDLALPHAYGLTEQEGVGHLLCRRARVAVTTGVQTQAL